MMGEELVKVIEYNEIGKVSFVRRSSGGKLKITIRPFKGVLVTVPRFVSIESAGKFVEEKKSWIKKSQLRLTRYEKRVTVFDENVSFSTKDHNLVISRHIKSTIRTIIGQGIIQVNIPDFADIKDPRIQNAIKKAIHQAWRIEARKYLPERINQLSQKYNLSFRKVNVRDNKTRWGSCSRDNSISLNIHLMRLPQQLSDYIILHELAHTVHKNHQKSFWQYLDGLTNGKSRMLDKELNGYSPEIW